MKSKNDLAKCENCGCELVGFLSENYEAEVIFCSLECNEEYSGDEE